VYALLIIFMMWLRPQGLVGASNSILAGGVIRIGRRRGTEQKSQSAAGGK